MVDNWMMEPVVQYGILAFSHRPSSRGDLADRQPTSQGVAGGRGSCLPGARQCRGRLADQEGQPAEHVSFDGEARRAGRPGDAILITGRRERTRPVRRLGRQHRIEVQVIQVAYARRGARGSVSHGTP